MIPNEIARKYDIKEWRNGLSVLSAARPHEWREIIEVLMEFSLFKSDILKPGGGKSPIARRLDSRFFQLGWQEKAFDTKIIVDDIVHTTPTHKVDCFKNRVALEVEWNNKDPFYDRDLNNFRLLFDLHAIDVGVIVTRSTELQTVFNSLGKGASYGASTTHMDKLAPRLDGGGGGGCPVVVFGIRKEAYIDK